MMHPDDHDDTIRHTPGAFALMAAVFETAMLDAADPRYRLSALRWLLSEGAVWAVEYGGADPAAYRERIRSIKVVAREIEWIDAEHFLAPLCKRGHEYRNTGRTLRRTYKGLSYCVECDRITNREAKRRAAAKREVTPTYLGPLCPRGHDHQGKGQSLRYQRNRYCIECARIARAKTRQKQRDETGPRGAQTQIGPLCNRGHRYNGQDVSLRYTRSGTSGGNCVECSRMRRRRVVERQLEEAV